MPAAQYGLNLRLPPSTGVPGGAEACACGGYRAAGIYAAARCAITGGEAVHHAARPQIGGESSLSQFSLELPRTPVLYFSHWRADWQPAHAGACPKPIYKEN